MRVLFSLAVLMSAGLLFLVQPMAAKMVLPSLGGSPAVWVTCMVFFQAVLLLGYAYAHLLTRALAPRRQLVVHAALLVAPLAVLPLSITPSAGAAAEAPVRWLLSTLFVALAAPFFVLSTTGPLLQRWFSLTAHRDAANPYFLYATSNVGSLGALLAYPLLVEPALRLGGGDRAFIPRAGQGLSQAALWSLGYLLFALLTLACGLAMLRQYRGVRAADVPEPGEAPSLVQRLGWVLLAAVPSSTMLGATQYLTTDIAAVPLLWVAPLAIYLLTFVVAFSRRASLPLAWTSPALALCCLATAASLGGYGRPPIFVALSLHLLTVAAAGVVCHGRLWLGRPAPARLTEFYLWIALGGVLGGTFNALIAPLLFRSVVEYPLALALAAVLRPGRAPRWRADLLSFVGLAAVLAALHAGLAHFGPAAPDARMWLETGAVSAVLLAWIARPVRFALGLTLLLATGWMRAGIAVETVHRERTFFGVLRVVRFEGTRFRVTDDPGRIVQVPMHVLFHGTTRHGTQLLDPKLRFRASSYFHLSGPIGHVFRAFRRSAQLDSVAVIGLGAGTLAAYGEAGQEFAFYEIDPAVVRVAEDPRLFTYLRDCRASRRTVVGDGRIALSREPDGKFGLIVLDAFSSDAMPVHLLTREAVALYLTKLRPDGLLVFNITSQYFDLRPVIAAIGADLGLAGLAWDDRRVSATELKEGKDASTFAVLARHAAVLARLQGESRWVELAPPVPARRWLWTDDASSILSALR